MPSSPKFGILNLDKPAGLTSRDVVDQVVRFARPAKVGHAGTLDPLATGVLVVCVGKATRLIDTIQRESKSYRATFLLGRESDTDDVEGNVVETTASPAVTRADVEAALPAFVGRIEQVPPAYSAVHVAGKRAYERARRGETVLLAPRPVDVCRLAVTKFVYPELELEIDCGSGTYVRSIGRDIGKKLGCGAVMSALVRTRIGPFRIEDAITLERLSSEGLDACLLNAATGVASLPRYAAQPDDVAQIRHGRPFGNANSLDGIGGSSIAVLDSAGELLCLAEIDQAASQLLPRQVFIE